MAKYAQVRNSDDAIVKTKNLDNFDANAVAHKFGPSFEFRIIPVNRLADPVYDSATQRLGPLQTTVLPDEVQEVRTVVAIPQQELDDAAELIQIKDGIDTLQTAITEIQDGTGDSVGVRALRMEQTIVKLCRGMIRMAKDQYGS